MVCFVFLLVYLDNKYLVDTMKWYHDVHSNRVYNLQNLISYRGNSSSSASRQPTSLNSISRRLLHDFLVQ